ncbi:MAG: hypothetical protein VX874_15955 [Pseudomonadota bacterium]|nr:hypothetical protein [Pseudomonadota bacterium]
MSITIQDLDGNDVEVFAAFDGGSLRCMTRSPDRATFESVALSVGLMEYANAGSPELRDAETGEVLREAVEPSGPLRPLRGITIAHLGSLVLTPGTYDDEGDEVTAPVLDTRHHANFWLPPHMVERGLWKKWAIAWSHHGEQVAESNKAEDALALNGIELIDPATVASPSNVLAGF